MRARSTWFSSAAILSAGVALLLASSYAAASTPLPSPDTGQGAAMESFIPSGPFTPVVKPHSANPNETRTFVLKMAGDSVAEVEKKTRTKLDDGQREQIRGDLKSKQDALDGDIQANGATVLSKFQDAYNGIKVQAPVSKVSALGSLRNVVAVKPLAIHQLENTQSVPFIGSPGAWTGAAGVRGEGVKIGIIDTGIDYTHADFGGPGTVDSFNVALAAKRANQLPDPSWFGPGAPKVKGGIDLVGDDYNANLPPGDPRTIPHPGVNPLDCYGHGSHVAGTAAGFGVTSGGATYSGPYNSATYSSTDFRVGPGVAPKADVYAIRVFGCQGSTNVVVDALNWAVANRMDVVNMSLGSSYGDTGDPSAEASNNAAEAGIIVVASAGNSGPSPYITGSPAVAERAISVAAEDTLASFPAYNLTLYPGGPLVVLNSNNSSSGPISGLATYVLPLTSGYSGCSESEYPDALITGKLVVTVRGSCARVDRAIFGAKHGAAAVALINNSPGYPAYEGPIPGVNIPFLGVRGADRGLLFGAGAATTVDIRSSTTLANSGYKKYAGFTSAGPSRADISVKPDVTAPGVSIMSVSSGSGNGVIGNSGTSMAAPHVSGLAALVRQAHPDWDQEEQRAAIVNTATIDPGKVFPGSNKVSRGGAATVQANAAVRTQAIATTEEDATSLSFGFNELTADYSRMLEFRVVNHGTAPITFNTSVVKDSISRPHSIAPSAPSVTVGPDDSGKVQVTLSVPASTVLDAAAFREVSGAIVLTPAAAGMNSNVSLRMPYLMIPRARSNVATALAKGLSSESPNGTATITNSGGTIAGAPSFYAWGLQGHNKHLGELGIRAVGAQSNPANGVLTFAVNTFGPFVTPNVREYDILIDTAGSGSPNWVLSAIDLGKATDNAYSGLYATILCDMPSALKCVPEYIARAPFHGSTIQMRVDIVDLGLTAASPRFTYSAQSYDIKGDLGNASDVVSGTAEFNAFTPAIRAGLPSYAVAPEATVIATISINPDEWDETPAKGLMVVTWDNPSGAGQAQLIPVRH